MRGPSVGVDILDIALREDVVEDGRLGHQPPELTAVLFVAAHYPLSRIVDECEVTGCRLKRPVDVQLGADPVFPRQRKVGPVRCQDGGIRVGRIASAWRITVNGGAVGGQFDSLGGGERVRLQERLAPVRVVELDPHDNGSTALVRIQRRAVRDGDGVLG